MNRALVLLVALFCASLTHNPAIGTQDALEENLASGTSFDFKDDDDDGADRLRRSGDRYSQPAYGYQSSYSAYPSSYGQSSYASPPYSPSAYRGNTYQTYQNPGYQGYSQYGGSSGYGGGSYDNGYGYGGYGNYGGDNNYAPVAQYRAPTSQYREPVYQSGGYGYPQTPSYGGSYMGRSDAEVVEDEDQAEKDLLERRRRCSDCPSKPSRCWKNRWCSNHNCC